MTIKNKLINIFKLGEAVGGVDALFYSMSPGDAEEQQASRENSVYDPKSPDYHLIVGIFGAIVGIEQQANSYGIEFDLYSMRYANRVYKFLINYYPFFINDTPWREEDEKIICEETELLPKVSTKDFLIKGGTIGSIISNLSEYLEEIENYWWTLQTFFEE